jgi:hypothetical protein
VTVQVQAIQRLVFNGIRSSFVPRYGQIEGHRLAQITVDKLFGRATSVKGNDGSLSAQFAAEIADKNELIRDAAFVSLLASLEVETADQSPVVRRRLVDSVRWLEQFGNIPPDAYRPEALFRIEHALGQKRCS